MVVVQIFGGSFSGRTLFCFFCSSFLVFLLKAFYYFTKHTVTGQIAQSRERAASVLSADRDRSRAL